MKRLLSIVSLFAAFSALAFDAASYVQDGLIAQWDGITHDPIVKDENNVSYWNDLVAGYAFKLTNNVSVVGKGLLFDGTSAAKTWGELSDDDMSTLLLSRKNYTLEVVVSFPNKQNQSYIFRSDSSTGIGFGAMDNDLNGDTVTQFALAGHGYSSQPLTLGHDEYVNRTNTYAITYTNHAVNAAAVNGGLRDLDESSAAKKLSSMYHKTSIGASATGSYQTKMTFFAIRIYERVLTDDEIAYNAAVDDVRFRDVQTTTREIAATSNGKLTNLGTPTPDYGKFVASLGETVAFSIADKMMDYDDGVRAFSAGEGHRAFYRDATVDLGGSVETVTSTEFSRTLVAGMNAVTWNFTNEQYLVAVSVEGGGSVLGAGWAAVADETVTLTAVPTEGMRFFAWEGLPDGVGDPYAATLTLPLDGPYALTAKFVAQLYPGETYPGGYAFVTANWTDPKSKVPAGTDSASNDLEARFRTVGEFGAGDFDPNQVPGLLLLVR